jgi:hypothetical protein
MITRHQLDNIEYEISQLRRSPIPVIYEDTFKRLESTVTLLVTEVVRLQELYEAQPNKRQLSDDEFDTLINGS